MLRQPENVAFCSEMRRREWRSEIAATLNDSAPNTVIGLLGGTGVGKSSLLNALLEQSNILPTSGSRGCNAAVVELRFNRGLAMPGVQTPVYRGLVEFISLQEWYTELGYLLDECCTRDSQKVFSGVPDSGTQPDAAAAWSKINEVYGHRVMSSFAGKDKAWVWGKLKNDERVTQLLTGENDLARTISIVEGSVDPDQAYLLCTGLDNFKLKFGRELRKWAKHFRSQINDFVYRKGGTKQKEPQTWPLIRKVTLFGPWAVLSTGACLVDLPGVQDANAARAQVAQTYLQKCDQIWIVAPIKRAVDDGTAKELLGAQFKRQMLMDGQYGNICFICTSTDDCQASEIIMDHEDVAKSVEGRWEQLEQLEQLDKEEESLKEKVCEAGEILEDAKGQVEGDDDRADDESDDSLDTQARDTTFIKDLEDDCEDKKRKLRDWQERSAPFRQQLRALASKVRNEYSTRRLQEDFMSGLKELTSTSDDGEEDDPTFGDSNQDFGPLPVEFKLEVHCVSSNDYLKIRKIKSGSDGDPLIFANAEDTQIPSLQVAVHKTTARFQFSYANTFVNTTSNILDRIKLCATEKKKESVLGPGLRRVFTDTVEGLEKKLEPIASAFAQEVGELIDNRLQQALKVGSFRSKKVAMRTVHSWGAKNRRPKKGRLPNETGLHFSTYECTLKRRGVYSSATSGAINFSQELCEPMERKISSEWQRTMDSAMRRLLLKSERKIYQVQTSIAQAITTALLNAGMDAMRLKTMDHTANQNCSAAIRNAFIAIHGVSTDSQRVLNRSLLPKVTER